MIARGQTLLFQGDSITNAFRMPQERNTSYQLGAGYVLQVCAHLQAHRPGDQLTCINRGVAGDNLHRLTARWQADCLDLRPDVISLLVGINDTGGSVGRAAPESPHASFAANYRALLTATRAVLPRVQFILGEPFGLEVEMFTPAWREDLLPRQAAVRQLAAEFGGIFIPYQAAFDAAAQQAPAAYWIYDGIHPTAAGSGLMADLWLRTVLG